MSVLRNIEHKIEGLFEGVFGRAFRTHVQPVELARKLVKEMEDHRVISVSRVYAPNEYTVYLAPSDREQFASYEDSLRSELQEYLAENARRERYELLSPPEVKLETDDGVTGWGEPVIEGRAHTVAAVEETADYLIGKDPLRIEDHWQVLWKGGFYRRGPVLASAVAGIGSGAVGRGRQGVGCAGAPAPWRARA